MESTVYIMAFYIIGAAACLGALGVVFLKNVVHAAFSLFFSLFSVAGLFVLLSADFIAAIQLIVYVGGILILLLFGILFTTEIYKLEVKKPVLNVFTGLLISVPLLLAGGYIILNTKWNLKEVVFKPTTEEIGNLLLGKYLLPFEIISIVLLAVMLGAIVLVRKELKGRR